MAPLSSYLKRIIASTKLPSTSRLAARAGTAHPQPTVNPNYHPGALTTDPRHINNNAFFALFALIGVGMVFVAIWFFFWAKNGGFVFRKGDWDDYKSTVLRRKGPNGTTLSGATKTTRLGGGSIVAHDVDEEKGATRWKRGAQGNEFAAANAESAGRYGGRKNKEDEDVRAYRHEKPARVGGINREADGLAGRGAPEQHDFAYSDTYSDGPDSASVYVPINTPRKGATKASGTPTNKRYQAQAQQDPSTPTPKRNRAAQPHLYATPNSNASTDSHRPLRPNAAMPGSGSPYTSREREARERREREQQHRMSSPRKSGHAAAASPAGSHTTRPSIPGSFCDDPLDYDSRYTQSDIGTDDSRGTKTYKHDLNAATNGARRGNAAERGYRRGGGGFRDSLFDSEDGDRY